MTDSLSTLLGSLNQMTDQQYAFLLFKLLGILMLGLTGLFTFLVTAYKAFLILWGMAVRHMAASLSPNYVTRQDFDKRISDLLASIESVSHLATQNVSRFDEGAARMDILERSLINHIEAPHVR